MANRHLARSVVLQSLFEWDFREVDNNLIGDIVVRNAEEFAPGMSDFSFAKKLADGVVKKKADLDMIIGKAAPEWPIEKIANVLTPDGYFVMGAAETMIGNNDLFLKVENVKTGIYQKVKKK